MIRICLLLFSFLFSLKIFAVISIKKMDSAVIPRAEDSIVISMLPSSFLGSETVQMMFVEEGDSLKFLVINRDTEITETLFIETFLPKCWLSILKENNESLWLLIPLFLEYEIQTSSRPATLSLSKWNSSISLTKKIRDHFQGQINIIRHKANNGDSESIAFIERFKKILGDLFEIYAPILIEEERSGSSKEISHNTLIARTIRNLAPQKERMIHTVRRDPDSHEAGESTSALSCLEEERESSSSADALEVAAEGQHVFGDTVGSSLGGGGVGSSLGASFFGPRSYL